MPTLSSPNRPSDGRLRVAQVAIVALALIVGLNVATWPRQQLTQQLEPLINEILVPPTTSQCADCHQDIAEQFPKTGHARTLWRGDDPSILSRFDNQQYRWTPDGPLFRYRAAKDGLWLTQEGSPLRLQVDWVMGSGTRSQGPVHLAENSSGATELCEHLLAWYPSVGVAPALGNDSKQIVTHGMAALGQWHEHANTKECLGCHSTHVPLDPAGKIESRQVIAGVGCVRCHPDSDRHVAANGAASAFRERWSKLSPQEVIHRCGECHRRADEVSPEDLNSELLHIVRFAPVGLSQSRCFQSQSREGPYTPRGRLDCLSCHDVHRPMSKDSTAYNKVCQSCHSAQQPSSPSCKAQPQTSNCVSCHMPLIATNPHMKFTDHWIRVHKP